MTKMNVNKFCIETYPAPMPGAEGNNIKSIRIEAVKLFLDEVTTT